MAVIAPIWAIGPAGCTTETIMAHHTRATFVEPGPSEPAGAFIAGILPLGSVAYDNRSLPLLSSNGRFVATQVGGPPQWDTLLSAPDSPMPMDSRIEIYRLDYDRGEAQLQWVTGRGLLLGRGGDERGFLIEQPQTDGARWIGSMSWLGDTTRWLVDDEHVNAFGALGPDGRLAWSRRSGGAEHFDLVIRNGREQWTVGAQGGDWLLPVWTGTGADLFVLRLEDGQLEAVYMNATSPESTRQGVVRVLIAEQRTRYDAYQCLASHSHTGSGQPSLLLWHPSATRMALWLPLSSPEALTLLEPQSMAAVLDDSGNMLVATGQGVVLVSPVDSHRRRTLVPGTHVLRPLTDRNWPYMVLSPRGDRIGLMALRLVPYDQ
jgi:hypothetical protein